MQVRRTALFACVVLTLISMNAAAQPAPEPSRDVPYHLDSGLIPASKIGGERENSLRQVWAAEVHVPAAPWMRVHFSPETILSSEPGAAGRSYLLITSARDGAQQVFDAHTLSQWSHISAFLNGDTVHVELYAAPRTGDHRVKITQVTAGIEAGLDTICGSTDDRVPHNDPRIGRLSVGCTAFMIVSSQDNSNEFLTAGHCLSVGQTGVVIMFNVPAATSNGTFVAPPVEFQYPLVPESIGVSNNGIGDDYARFRTWRNSNTHLPARLAQGQGAFIRASSAPQSGTASTAVRGFGSVNGQATIPNVPWQWNRINKTHTAEYRGRSGDRINYVTDASPGNSGSPVIQTLTSGPDAERVIGIHTHGLCPLTPNAGTAIDNFGLRSLISLAPSTGDRFDTTASGVLNMSFTSANLTTADGGAIFFTVDVADRALLVTHLNFNIGANGTSPNGTSNELDDFFNFSVYAKQGSAFGWETTPSAWTLVSTGAGMPRPRGQVSVGALREPFWLSAFRTYGVAVVFDNGAGHATMLANVLNRSNSDDRLTIRGVSASHDPWNSHLPDHMFSGGIGYLANHTPGQCFQTGTRNHATIGTGSTMYFDVMVKDQPITITRITTSIVGVGGSNVGVQVYKTPDTYAGKETRAGEWTLVATGSSLSVAAPTPTEFTLDTPIELSAHASLGLAVRVVGGSMYTDGTGYRQIYENNHMRSIHGSRTSGLFSGNVVQDSVFVGSLCYGVNLVPCSASLMAHTPPNPALGGLASSPGGQEQADSFDKVDNWTLSAVTFWGAYANQNQPPGAQDFIVRVFHDAGGLPGALIAAPLIASVVPRDSGMMMGGGFDKPIYQFTATLGSPIDLPPGRYWLSILGVSPTHTWAWARVNADANARATRLGIGDWTLAEGDFAWTLCGESSPYCYADCDTSTGVGVLDIFDFLCFGNRFSANDPYACDCDTSTGPGVCDIFDFLCFGNEFNAGCP